MRHSLRLLIALAPLLGSGIAHASSADREAKLAADQDSTKDAFDAFGPSSPLSTLPDTRTLLPDGASDKPSAVVLPQINASSDDNRATFRISMITPGYELDRHGSDENWTITQNSWNLAISAPLDKSGSSSVLSSDSLPSDFLAKFSFTQFIGKVRQDTDTQDTLYRKALGAYETKCGLTKNPGESATAFDSRIVAACGPDDAETLVPNFLSDQEKEVYYKGINEYALIWGANASAGYQKFDFFNALTAAKANSTGTPWSVGAMFAFSPDDSYLLSGAFNYQRSYKAGTNGTLCPAPSPIPPVLTCVTGAIGAPKEMEQELASLEFKKLLPLPDPLAALGLKHLGLDAKFSYDLKSDVYNFDVPLSFVADDKGNLVGGIEFGWTSDKHQFVAGLFLSSAFSLNAVD